jgi:16S rRNA (guanine(966)-N(2))-methyltransferase RsmD
LKGRRLRTPTWDGLRPTSDKLRETLFNILLPQISGARVLDAFAGTGALGIEALSRGAREVTFIERDPRAVALIEANLAHCGIETSYTVIRSSLEPGLERLRAAAAFVPFDVVLLDPPYGLSTSQALDGCESVISSDGILALEHARRQPAPESAGRLVRVRQVHSGDSTLSFYTLGVGT